MLASLFILGYAAECRVRRLSREETLENEIRQLQEEYDRGITIGGTYFPTMEALEEEHAKLCREVATLKSMCRNVGLEDWVPGEDDSDILQSGLHEIQRTLATASEMLSE